MASWQIRDAADFARLVQLGVTTESIHLDFKAALDRGPNCQAEVGRDVSQFANEQGGCLLIGVEEQLDAATGVKTAKSCVGVADPDRCRQDIETWIRNVLAPADLSREIVFVPVGNVRLVSVNISASRRLIWVADPGQQNRLEVVRRTNHGKEYMRPAEIERRWSNSPRAAQISFHDALAVLAKVGVQATAVDVHLVGGVSRISQNLKGRVMQTTSAPMSLGAHDPSGFELRVPLGKGIATLRVPFELLSSAWVDQNRLHIMCAAPVIYDGTTKALMFDPHDQLRY